MRYLKTCDTLRNPSLHTTTERSYLVCVESVYHRSHHYCVDICNTLEEAELRCEELGDEYYIMEAPKVDRNYFG